VLARRLLALLPTAEGGARHARLMPLQEQPELDATQTAPALPTEWGALDAWRRIEDLWLRLATTISPIFTQDHGDRQLAWVGFKPRTDTDFLVLRGQVLDLESYRWFEDGRPRSLVSLMQWERDDLRMDLAATRQLARWREGDTLDWHLKGFLAKHAVLSSTGTTRERAA